MLNETMIQLILIAICCVYIIFNTKADKNPKRGYRTALYLFVMAGIISYIMNYLNLKISGVSNMYIVCGKNRFCSAILNLSRL